MKYVLALLLCLTQTLAFAQSQMINSSTGKPYTKGDTLKAQDLQTILQTKQDYPAVNIGSLNSLTLGGPGVSGQLVQRGSTSGQVTIQAPAVAGSPVVTWGNTTGTPAVSATAPVAINSVTGVVTCVSCYTTAGGTVSGNVVATGNIQGGTSPANIPFSYRNTADGVVGLIAGNTKGVRFTYNGSASGIEGVDNTGVSSFQPLNFGSSAYGWSLSGGAAALAYVVSGRLDIGVNGTAGGAALFNGSSTGNRTLAVTTNGSAFTFGGGALTVAEGGTGDTGTAWSAFTPSFSCGTATFTNNSSRSKTMGKTTWIQFEFTITAIGTCTNQVNFILPNNAQSTFMLSGQETAVNGIMMGCKQAGANTAACVKNTIANFLVNEHFAASGVYENQ